MASLSAQLRRRRAALVSAGASDPRALTTLATGSVSIPASCAYYGVVDAVSRCRVPRSCQDCLAMPGCGLTSSGLCRNVTLDAVSFAHSQDYRTANFSAGSLVSNTSSFVFTADSATYCAASDPVCTKCREQFQADDANTTSGVYAETQFCKGADGCVCIAICEVPRRRAARGVDWSCGQPFINIYPLPVVTRGSDMIIRGDPRAPAVNRTRPPKETDSCEYTKAVDLRGCRRPRSCQSCLDQPACEIIQGRCYGATTGYSWSRDYRNASLDANNRSSASYYGFRSANTTYCPPSDATCAACRQTFRESRDMVLLDDNVFCVGQDGCVCIELCESELWTSAIGDTECNRASTRQYAAHVNFVFIVGAAPIAWMLLYKYFFRKYIARVRVRQRSHPERGIFRNMLDEVPALPRLDLFGWRAYQQELHHREQELLHGRDICRPLRHHIDFDNVDPSAPEFDDDESSAPTAQDPKALASAPMYRRSLHENDSTSEDALSTQETDHSSPSAPDFEFDEVEWDARLSQREVSGYVTRRSRRGQ